MSHTCEQKHAGKGLLFYMNAHVLSQTVGIYQRNFQKNGEKMQISGYFSHFLTLS